MSKDGRNDFRGPGNSGFIYIKSNCKTLLFMNAMIEMIGAVIVGRSDQILWNFMMKEEYFKNKIGLKFDILDTNYFIGGYQVNLKKGTKRKDFKYENDHYIVHASWTTDQFDKIEKFYNLNHWYFNDEQCINIFETKLLPDLKDRAWEIRKKTSEQEKRLLELGICIDSSNGQFTTQT